MLIHIANSEITVPNVRYDSCLAYEQMLAMKFVISFHSGLISTISA